MQGYLNNPEETAKAIDAEGYFHTGDIGELDEIGRITITDRLKNLIILGNGKNVSPGPMEAALSASKYVAQAVILGDNQPYTGVLIAPDFEELEKWAAANGIAEAPPEQLIEIKEVEKLLDAEVKRALEPFAIYERPRRTALLPRALTEEAGELTPTLKTKMRVVADNWKDQIDYLFDEKRGRRVAARSLGPMRMWTLDAWKARSSVPSAQDVRMCPNAHAKVRSVALPPPEAGAGCASGAII